jgi:tetratricopeptide (TPR) repeat protein
MKISAAIALFLLPVVLVSARGESGADAYRAGEFARAAELFENELDRGPSSAGLYFNLGLALKKAGDPARASLNLRRALMLDPLLVDARIELSDLERAQGIPLSPVDWRVHFAERVPLMPVLVAGFALFWLGAFWLLLLAWAGSRRFLPAASGILTLLAGAALFLGAYSSDPRFLWRSAQVVIEPASLLATPAERSESVVRLPVGSMVHALRSSGSWVFASLPDGTDGWVAAANLTPLVPVQN